MKKIYFLSIYCLLLLTCQQNTAPKPFEGERQFRATDPSRLFFKNIKSVAYYRSRRPNSKIDIYQFRKFSRTDKRPIIYPMILDNWLDNEAYIFLEKNAFSKFASPLTIKAESETDSIIFEIAIFNKKNQYAFAEKIFDAMNDRKTLTVKTKEGSFIPIFENYQDKSNFMITMKDYFRLIERDRKK